MIVGHFLDTLSFRSGFQKIIINIETKDEYIEKFFDDAERLREEYGDYDVENIFLSRTDDYIYICLDIQKGE